MGGTAPANQLRLSFTGSEDGEAATETCRVAKPLWRTMTRTSGPLRAQLTEPPYADPPVRWCGRGEQVTAPPIPICCEISGEPVGFAKSTFDESLLQHFFV